MPSLMVLISIADFKLPKVILTTADTTFAIEAFEYSCIVDYFEKPITQARLDMKRPNCFPIPKLD
jgi:two-component SAPR family response regulator